MRVTEMTELRNSLYAAFSTHVHQFLSNEKSTRLDEVHFISWFALYKKMSSSDDSFLLKQLC